MADNSNPERKRGPGRPFKKGQSPNPGGRPKAVKEVIELAREHTTHAVRRLAELLDDPDGRVVVAAAKELLDRGYGKAPQAITGLDGGPIQIMKVDELTDEQLAAIIAAGAKTE